MAPLARRSFKRLGLRSLWGIKISPRILRRVKPVNDIAFIGSLELRTVSFMSGMVTKCFIGHRAKNFCFQGIPCKNWLPPWRRV